MKRNGNRLLLFIVQGIFTSVMLSVFITSYRSYAASNRLFNLHNQARSEFGVNKLNRVPLLTNLAKKRACYIYEERQWSHDGFQDFAALYPHTYFGENLARNYPSQEEMFKALMDSPTHRANILDRQFNKVGIATCGNITVMLYAD